MHLKKTNLDKTFAFFGMWGVILGAFGAHAIRAHVSVELLENWKTATLYLFVHVVAGLYSTHFSARHRSAYCFLIGIFLFSGSLYTYVLTNFKLCGMITPVGGAFFILGWFLPFFK